MMAHNASDERSADKINKLLETDDVPLRCDFKEHKGRVLIATRGVQPGDVIYTETPLQTVSVPAEGPVAYEYSKLAAFAKIHHLEYNINLCWCALNSLTAGDHSNSLLETIPEDAQAKLLLLHIPEIEVTPARADTMKGLLAEMVGEISVHLDVKLLRIILAFKYNSFEGKNDQDTTVIFFRSAFHSHSCDPNASWKEHESSFVLRARCAIAEGEEVCISYLSEDELYLSTIERRARLLQSKGFECPCPRCSATWDTCRGFRCACGGVRFISSQGLSASLLSGAADAISGCKCGTEISSSHLSEILGKETMLTSVVKSNIEEGKADRFATAMVHLEYAEATFLDHWLLEKLWTWMSEGCATKLETEKYQQKRLDFMTKAYEGSGNSYMAWVKQDLRCGN